MKADELFAQRSARGDSSANMANLALTRPWPIFSRLTAMPAFSRSQVSSVRPTARSFTFSILAVGVRGSAFDECARNGGS